MSINDLEKELNNRAAALQIFSVPNGWTVLLYAPGDMEACQETGATLAIAIAKALRAWDGTK